MSTADLPTWQDYAPGDFDVCVWCQATGCLIAAKRAVEHSPTCPSTTGLWPVMPDDVRQGVICVACGVPYALGDYTARVPHPDRPDVSVVMCLSCALTRRSDAWPT